MQRHQRGGAGGVHGDGGALQAERVGDPPGHHAHRVPRHQEPLDGFGGAGAQRRVPLVDGRGVHPGAAAPQGERVDAGLLDGLPGRHQQHPLLRVHRDRLAGRDAEELRVEVGRAVQERPPPGDGAAGRPGALPAPVAGDGRDGVAAFGEQLPQLLRGADPAGEAAAHRHDRDRLAGPGLGLPEPLPGLAEVDGHPVEVVAHPLVAHWTPLLSSRAARVSSRRTRGVRGAREARDGVMRTPTAGRGTRTSRRRWPPRSARGPGRPGRPGRPPGGRGRPVPRRAAGGTALPGAGRRVPR